MTRLKVKPKLSARVRTVLEERVAKSPARFAIVVFTSLILFFAFLLALPISSASGEWTYWVDALFTAVSVICVTGLATVDMALHWSAFGHSVIFIGVEIGALGVLTLASILGLIFARKLGLRAKLLAASDSNPVRQRLGPVSESQAIRLGEIGSLLITVAVSLVVIELVLALLLFPSFLLAGMDWFEALWQSIFYSEMSFTNTGFTLNAEGLTLFENNYWVLSLMMIGVLMGSFGFPVIYALTRQFKNRKHWSLHVKLTLTMVFGLFFAGGILFAILEGGNSATWGTKPLAEQIYHSFFLSTMTRSGGFSLINPDDLTGGSMAVADILMFIGGGSASTAGGIKVTTIAVLFLAAYAEATGREDMEAFGRRIPNDVLRVAISVLLLSVSTIIVATITLQHFTGAPLERIMFDVFSAFGTTGLSSGFTAETSDLGKLILLGTMCMGRVGTVTLAVAVGARTKHQLFRQAEERPIVG